MNIIQLSSPLKSIILIVILSTLFSCSNNGPKSQESTTINVGVLPDQNKDILKKKYHDLLKYLEKETGLDFILIVPESYAELIKLFNQGEIDLGYFGGVSFVQVYLESKSEPLVFRDKDIKFTSSFITKSINSSNGIRDFKNKSLLFGSKSSTSGHIMPRYFMDIEKIIPETFFSKVEYSGRHDLTIQLILSGGFDIGVVNSLIIKEMIADGRIEEEDVSVIWETPTYSDYVWATQEKMDSMVKVKIRNAFLSLSKDDPIQRSILDKLDGDHFIPAGVHDFSAIIKIFKEMVSKN
jgi:phosphonate transport system substrate-binding protein